MKDGIADVSFLKVIINTLAKELPPIFARKEAPKLLGGSIAAGTLANLGKKGPKYFFINRNAVYEKETFLEWLKTVIREADE